MDETPHSFSENELSAEDLAVLQEFYSFFPQDKALEKLPEESTATSSGSKGGDQSGGSDPRPYISSVNKGGNQPGGPDPRPYIDIDEMLALFATEAGEDIQMMRKALDGLEQDDSANSPELAMLQSTAHKLKGSAGAIGCEYISRIAYYIEQIARQIQGGIIKDLTGVIALVQAVHALEVTLESVRVGGPESKVPLTELEDGYQGLHIDIDEPDKSGTDRVLGPPAGSLYRSVATEQAVHEEGMLIHITPASFSEASSQEATARVDVRRLKQLVQHAEQLVEQHLPLESAQKRVEEALHELYAAQARLRRLEALLATLPYSPDSNSEERIHADHPASSLVARILDEAVQRIGYVPQRKNRILLQATHLPGAELWDEMEIDRYTESNVLVQSLNEALADVTTASSQLQVALAQLTSALQLHISQADMVRNDVLLLQSAPLTTLAARLQRAIDMIAKGPGQQVLFEVIGEATEIDQAILDALVNPFLQLVRTCVADSLIATRISEQSEARADESALYCRIWLYGSVIGSEVTLELGFSRPVQGGALDTMRETIARLNGTVTVQRNTSGGISFFLRFPRSQGMVQGLLVRADNQDLIVPFSQVQRIDYGRQELYTSRYTLQELLGSAESNRQETARPLLVLQQPAPSSTAIEVDEVLGEVEMVMKPLALHLQRPGIAGTAIDGMSNVLLIVNLPELVRQWDILARLSSAKSRVKERKQLYHPFGDPSLHSGLRLRASSHRAPRTVLIADDSLSMRQSVSQILSRAGYLVMEAHDGMEALEKLLEEPPDVLLLDIEMPNLNGYDLLNILHGRSEFAQLKIVMLTSRSSQKHQRRAFDLGVSAYLIKPCPQDTLLETLQNVLRAR